jgi:hypothetical protein
MTRSGQSVSSSSIGGSQPWNEAGNAAGFVLRYLPSMREQLVQWLGSGPLADESLRRLIAHLVAQGFGEHGKGRIRDFLMRGIRSAARSTVADVAEPKRPVIDFTKWTPDAPAWIATWRKGLLNRVWRELERREHRDPSQCHYTALKFATEHPQEDAKMLAVRINTELKQKIEPKSIPAILVAGRALFAQLLEHEITETLDLGGDEAVLEEATILGLAGIFASAKQ